MIAASYQEATDTQSPATAGFNHDGGRASIVYLCSSADLVDSLQDLLGYTEKNGDGRLIRHLPRAHPRFPWLFVERIANIQGCGRFAKVTASTSQEADPVTHGTSYTQYRITVEFAPRPYALLEDAQIVLDTVLWTDIGTPTVTPTNSWYAQEWCRYTSIEVFPGIELITFQQGRMVLRRGDAAVPNLYTFPGMPAMRLPRAQWVFRWHQVPYEYVTSLVSHIVRYQGRVNQRAWFGFTPGSLLYTTFKARLYTPPWPVETTVPGGGITYNTKLCDIDFVFEHVSRTTASAPTPASLNWIAGGHNLVPWPGDRRFYFATAFKHDDAPNANYWVPIYESFPFELLFTDPDIEAPP